MEDLILRGPPCQQPPITDKGIGEVFFEQAEKFADKPFQIDADSGKQETYYVVKQRSVRVALYLKKIGIKPNDVVTLCCLNNLDNVVPVLATLYLGAHVSSVDPRQSVKEVKHALLQFKPKVMVVEKNSLELIKNGIKEAKQKPMIITIEDSSGHYPNMWDIEKEGHGESDFKPVKQKGSDIAAILFSSGTTSTPKGICLTNFGLLNLIPRMIQHNCFKPGVILHFASFIWISAWNTTTMCIITGGTKLIAPVIKGEQFLNIVEKYKVTWTMCSVPFTYQITNLPEETLKKYDTSSLYALAVGGSPLDPEQVLRLRKCLPHTFVNLTYGSTETNGVSGHNYTDPKNSSEKITSSGTLFPGVQIKVVDPDTQKLLGPGQKGEIRVKSDLLMSGYYNLIDLDAFDDESYFRIGDIGYYDVDQYVYVTGRSSEMFKYQSFQICPEILEDVISQHPAVKQAVVFGVPHPVDVNHPAGCVVLNPGSKVSVEELIGFVKGQVSDAYQLRGGLAIVHSIPLTPSGKYQRRVVKEQFMHQIRH